MGEKSRGNWNLPECVKFDCAARSKRACAECVRFSSYRKTEKKECLIHHRVYFGDECHYCKKERESLPVESPLAGSVPDLDQMALNHVASEMRKTAMKFVNDKDHSRLMRAGELLAKAIEKDASRIGAKGLMKQNVGHEFLEDAE